MLMLNVAGFLIAMVLTLLLVPVVRRRAIEAGHYDAPGERKIHKYPIPRLGGVAIWLGFMLALGLISLFMWHRELGSALPGVLAGGAIVFTLGLLDDLFNLSPYLKLAIQFIAALTAFGLGVQINNPNADVTLHFNHGDQLLGDRFVLPIREWPDRIEYHEPVLLSTVKPRQAADR